MGGVHICKSVGELNHLIMLSDVSSKSLVIILPISGEWASWERSQLLKFENHRFKRGAVFFFFLAESKLEDVDVS